MHKHTTPEVLAYTAGVLDSEGCVSLYKRGARRNSYEARVAVSQKRDSLLVYLSAHWGGKIRWADKASCYLWEMCRSANIIEILSACAPYLIVKRTQADLMCRYLRDRTAMNGDEVVAELKAMKREVR